MARMNASAEPVALVTGAARRIGSAIARSLHAAGYRVIVHCRQSKSEAAALAAELNAERANSARVIAADLDDIADVERLGREACAVWRRLDLLVNNASTFLPTTIGTTREADWEALMNSNLKAPYFLVQACLERLTNSRGSVVNLVDIHAERPLAGHTVYSTAKAGLHMLTRALAKELGPAVRVNGVSPGAILWPERDSDDTDRNRIVERTPLKRTGTPEDIARAVLFLAENRFITGQVIAVDGGRSL